MPIFDPIPNVSGYPSVDALIFAMAEAGIVVSGSGVATHLATAVAEWEKRTGWLPFLATGSDERSFDTDEWGIDTLDLRGGLVTVTSVAVRGAVLDARDYRMMPRNAPAQRLPYTWIDLRRNRKGEIVVTGRWGYADTCPDDVAAAILARACSLLAEPVVKAAATSAASTATPGGSLRRVTEGSVTHEWSETTSVTERRAVFEQWEKTWEGAVGRYKLETII